MSKQIEPLRYRHQNFDALIRHHIQALIFASFYQEKEESPSAASRGKPSVANKRLYLAIKPLTICSLIPKVIKNANLAQKKLRLINHQPKFY